MTRPILGLMQDRPLLISGILRHAANFNGEREIVCSQDGTARRYGYAALERRARAAAAMLARFGIRPGDRVATLAWNTDRHLELFYAVPGTGSILHTVNPRLWQDQLVYIINHAEDRVLFFDPDLLSLVLELAPKLTSIERYVMLSGVDALPAEAPIALSAYESEMPAEADFEWPEFDERIASILCYTSGTTGMPKGVLGSHRSVVLQALMAQSALAFGLTPFDSVLLIVPMFHAYGWSLPFVSAISGAKLVLPGPAPQPGAIVDLIHAEKTTLCTGVPTVWTGLFDHLDENGRTFGPLKRALIGGSAIPPKMSERLRSCGIKVLTGWGMTEMSPLGSFTSSTPEIEALAPADRNRMLDGRAGRVLFPVEVKLIDPEGQTRAFDGESHGELWVRGPSVASRYFRGEGGEILDRDGWFPTGDIAAIDRDGTIAISDRFKDLIKSGGEWIASSDLEAAASACEGVAQAAAIAAPHAKWQERPLLILVPNPGALLDEEIVLEAMAARLARWQLPDDIIIVQTLPLTATGKIDKKALREKYKDHLLQKEAVE